MSGSRRSADGAEPSRDGTDPNRSPNTSRNNRSGNEPSRNRAAGASSGSNRAASWSGSGAAGPSSGRAEEDVDLAQVLAYLLRSAFISVIETKLSQADQRLGSSAFISVIETKLSQADQRLGSSAFISVIETKLSQADQRLGSSAFISVIETKLSQADQRLGSSAFISVIETKLSQADQRLGSSAFISVIETKLSQADQRLGSSAFISVIETKLSQADQRLGSSAFISVIETKLSQADQRLGSSAFISVIETKLSQADQRLGSSAFISVIETKLSQADQRLGSSAFISVIETKLSQADQRLGSSAFISVIETKLSQADQRLGSSAFISVIETKLSQADQHQNVRLYDTRDGRFRLFKTIKARDVGWSVLDVAFTPDGAHLLYSSWSDYIHICSIDGDSESHTALDLNPDERRFCVFSLTTSSDGREILGGMRSIDWTSPVRVQAIPQPTVEGSSQGACAQLAERRPGGGRVRSARVSSAHQRPLWSGRAPAGFSVSCPRAALSSDAVALRRLHGLTMGACTFGSVSRTSERSRANDGCLYVFDREQNKRTLKIDSHEDDVNAVSFADASSQILFSGGDDALCKVWDRRTLREDSPQPVGQLAGHRDGITFIDSKQVPERGERVEGREIREYCWQQVPERGERVEGRRDWEYCWQQVPERGERVEGREIREYCWQQVPQREERGEGKRDKGVLLAASTREVWVERRGVEGREIREYCWQQVPTRCGERGGGMEGRETGSTAGNKYPREVRGEGWREERLGVLLATTLKKHRLPGDTSVMSYRGHGVLHTLIRCRFSPEFSTGQRYIYTGCSTGRVVGKRGGGAL
ncbi:UNVERIFIED_CONTAM: hypothetical protein FKN15_069175 [Acipenser sinensis]